MTMVVSLTGWRNSADPGRQVAVMAWNSKPTCRDWQTGEKLRGEERPASLHPLSIRHPIAVGTFGLAWARTAESEQSVTGAVARCRARFDGEGAGALPATYTVRDVAHGVAIELHHTFKGPLEKIARQGWPEPALREGARSGTSIVGGHVVGYPGGGGPVECWFLLVQAAGIVEMVQKFVGKPNHWHVSITPGADAAGAAIRQVIREVPGTLDHAARYAETLIQTEVSARSLEPDPTLAVGGPTGFLGLIPGSPPQVITPLHPPVAA